MDRVDAYRIIRRRTAAAGFEDRLGCQVLRATGLTAYLKGRDARERAGHGRTGKPAHAEALKLYDRTDGQVTLDEVKRITI
jgi:hypothetical protein